MSQISKRLAVAGALGFLLSASPAAANDDLLSKLPPDIARLIHPGTAIEQVIAMALAPIRQYDADGNGLDLNDIDTDAMVKAAQRRAMTISAYLTFDLDGDLKVTEAEIRTVLQRRNVNAQSNDKRQAWIDKEVGVRMDVDTDGDGALSIPEMLAGEDFWDLRREYEPLRRLVEQDPNHDGHLMPAEFEGIMRATFATVDRDGNGVIGPTEYAIYQSALEQAAEAEKYAGCTLPRAAEGETVTLLGMYDADTLPTVTVSGQDSTTSLARVIIEPGSAPLYVVVTAYTSMIWKFEGETSRLKHVAVLGGTSGGKGSWAGMAVLGLTKELVTFMPREVCGSGYDAEGKEGKLMTATIARAAGVAKIDPLYVYSAQAVSLPSGKPTEVHRDKDIIVTGSDTYAANEGESPVMVDGGLSPAYQENWLKKPGGILKIDPKDLIAPGKVEPYQVMPGQDGLRILVEQGTLERTADGYRVVKPLPRWPAGLGGAHSVKFYLPKGMPMPEGSPGHSKVTVEP